MRRNKVITGLSVLLTIVLSASIFAGSAFAKESGDELDRIQEEGILKVGVEGTYPPITYQ